MDEFTESTSTTNSDKNVESVSYSHCKTEIINKQIFRAYDIRGQIGKEWCLNNNYHDAFLVGQAIASQLVKQGSPEIIIGRDGRESSRGLAEQLIKGLVSCGCQVTDIGLVATPIVYFALAHLNIPNAAMVTGSHNPPDHNGIKIVYKSEPLSATSIESLYDDIVSRNILFSTFTTKGNHTFVEHIIDDYQQAVINNIQLSRPLRVGIDCGNGATSLYAENLFSQLNCDVFPLYCELDSTFPNHSPDPTVPENLTELAKLVKQQNLDIGIAFDGDGDRMIAVDNQGKILWPDRIMIFLAQDVLAKNPQANFVYDVKCSFLLPKAIEKYGGKPTMCISGHSTVKREMKHLNAIMGGEFSGHIIMPDRWSSFDDGPYVAARLLELLSQKEASSSKIFSQIPECFSTPEYKLYFENPTQAKALLNQFIQQANFSQAEISLIDGLRVDYADGWGIVRTSNTLPCLTFRFEALTSVRLTEIQDEFREIFKLTDNHQKLPF